MQSTLARPHSATAPSAAATLRSASSRQCQGRPRTPSPGVARAESSGPCGLSSGRACVFSSPACCTDSTTLCSPRDPCQAPLCRMKILVVGDSYMPARYFREAFAELDHVHELEYVQIDADRTFEPTTPSERQVREYQGSPRELAELVPGFEVLVVQGAPVTDAVLDASRELRLVCCARGGPVNVDLVAATARSLPVVNTPGKN